MQVEVPRRGQSHPLVMAGVDEIGAALVGEDVEPARLEPHEKGQGRQGLPGAGARAGDQKPPGDRRGDGSGKRGGGAIVGHGADGRGGGDPDEEANEEERADPCPPEPLSDMPVPIPDAIEGRSLGRFMRRTTGSPPSV